MSGRKKKINLKEQLKMYEDNDLDALEDLLTPSDISRLSDIKNKPNDNRTSFLKVQNDSDMEGHTDYDEDSKKDNVEEQISDDEEPVTIISEATQESDLSKSERVNGSSTDNGYPLLTDQIKKDISSLTKLFVKTKDQMSTLNRQKTNLAKQQKPREKKLIGYIQTYGLKDITMGKHQLVPQLVKGKKRGYNNQKIEENLKTFLATLDIVDEVEELAGQATDFLDNSRETSSDTVTLKHNML